MNLEALTTWTEPREVQTKYGPRILRKATPDETFWRLWAQRKDELKGLGLSVSKDLNSGAFQVCWWSKLGENESQRRAANLEASRSATTAFDPPKPPGLNYYPFQRAGIEFSLDKDGVLIADEMGLGKTVQALGIINCNESIKRVLIVTKASLKVNWRRECERWLVRSFTIGIAEGQYWPKQAEIVIINYDILGKHFRSLHPEIPWDLVILDESANIKNRNTKRAKNIIGYRPSLKRQAEGERVIPSIPAKRRVALSGTPIENRPEELWTTLNYLAPDKWGNFYGYAKRYCGMTNNGWGVDTSGATNLDELQRILRSTLMIRRLKADVLKELPPKTRVVIEMDSEGMEDVIEEDQECYRRHEEILEAAQAQLELARASDDAEAFKQAVREMQGANFAFTEMARVRHQTARAKVPAMIDALKGDLEEVTKVIVFGHHRDVLEPIAAAFPSVMITGETPPDQRQAICDQFQTDPSIRVFIGSIRACGEGLTLTAAKLVCFAEQDWTPGKVSQAEDRAHRIGQKDNVLVKHYVLPGTIDAKMIKTVVQKQEVIDRALDDDPGEYVNEPAFAPYKPLGKRKEIAEEALLITTDQVEAIHRGLQMLAGMCDGAFKMDGCGFNKIDARIGHALAESPFLTQKQAALGRRLCWKYKRQLGEQTLLAMGTTTTKKEQTQ